jgi:hypothetical protein
MFGENLMRLEWFTRWLTSWALGRLETILLLKKPADAKFIEND